MTITSPAVDLAWKREQWLVASSRLAEVVSSAVAEGLIDRSILDQNGVFTEWAKSEFAYFGGQLHS